MPYQLLPALILLLPEPGRKLDVLPLRGRIARARMMSLNTPAMLINGLPSQCILAFGYLQLIVQQERKAKRLQADGIQPFAHGEMPHGEIIQDEIIHGEVTRGQEIQSVPPCEQQANDELALPSVPHNV